MPRTHVRWIIASFLLLIGTHAFATRFGFSVAAHRIQIETGLTNIQIGTLLSAFILGYAVMQFPAGLLVDWLGPYRVLLVSLLGWSIFTLVAGAARWLPMAYVAIGLAAARLIAGAAQAGVLTCIIKAVSRWMPPQERATGNGLSMMGLGIGGAISPGLIVWLMSQHGWPFPFFVLGFTGLAIAAAWWWYGAESPELHSGVSPEELTYIRAGAPKESTVRTAPTPWRALARSRDAWALALSYGVAAYTSYVFFTWFFLYLVNVRKMSLVAGGFWSGLPYVAVALGTLAGGRVCDALTVRYGKRLGRLFVVLSGEGLAALLIALGGRIDNAYAAVILISLATGLHLIGQTASWAAAIDLAPTHPGTLFGVMNTLGQIAGTIAPIATPAIAARFGWITALDFAAAMVALAAALWILVDPSKPVTADRAP